MKLVDIASIVKQVDFYNIKMGYFIILNVYINGPDVYTNKFYLGDLIPLLKFGVLSWPLITSVKTNFFHCAKNSDKMIKTDHSVENSKIVIYSVSSTSKRVGSLHKEHQMLIIKK